MKMGALKALGSADRGRQRHWALTLLEDGHGNLLRAAADALGTVAQGLAVSDGLLRRDV